MEGRCPVALLWVVSMSLLTGAPADSAETVERRAVEVEGVVQSAVSACDETGCRTFLQTVPWDGHRLLEAIRDGEAMGTVWMVDEPPLARGTGDVSVRRLVADLPLETGGLTVCGGESGATTLMYQAGGSVYFVDPASEREAAPRGVRLGSASWSAPASAWSRGCGELFLVGDGRARFVRLAGSGTRRSLLSSTDFVLPTEVRRNPSGLTLETPTVRRLDETTNRVVIGPRSFDNLRLESVLFEPTAEVRQWLESGGSRGIDPPDESLDVLQAWSRLPAPEELLESTYLELHGRPVLVVVSKEADKVGLLERKKLRLFELAGDRSRTGRLPFFEVLTASRLWQQLDIEWVDLNGDGLDDLVLLQPEGLGGEALLVDVYFASAPLRLNPKARRSRLKTDQSAWTLRHDWSGDGLPDVLVQDAGFVQIYPASEISARRRNRSASVEWAQTPTGSFALAEPEAVGENASTRRRMWVDEHGVVVATSSVAESTDEGQESEGRTGPEAEPSRSVVEIFRPAVRIGPSGGGAPEPDR